MKHPLQTLLLLLIAQVALASNPIIPNQGANDPHIRIIDGKAYLSASHDRSSGSDQFVMDDWWLWSSDDLVNWKLEYTLDPKETYIGKDYTRCWATDIVKRNGKFYWYFSEGNEQTGVMVGDTPQGPWVDPLGKPLLASDLTPTHEYDMGIVQDDAGEFYIVFGVWAYYIAKLNEDMISLAEAPRKIVINNPRGPYNLDGKNTKKPTDDKPFMHSHNGHFYLSWGCFYAMGDNVYGPFDYKGSIVEQESFAPGYDAPTWPTGFRQGRHGAFFERKNQSYFAYCDISQTGNRYFRDTFVSYIHYKKNGEMALIRVDGVGVANYDANAKIEAEDYYDMSGMTKLEQDGFVMTAIDKGDYLLYSHVAGLEGKTSLELQFSEPANCTVEVRLDSPQGELLSTIACQGQQSTANIDTPLEDQATICLVFADVQGTVIAFDAFSFK